MDSGADELELEPIGSREAAAASKIQAAQRGNQVREELSRARTAELERQAAAAKIQAIGRGRQARAAEQRQLEVLTGLSSTIQTQSMRESLSAKGVPPLSDEAALALSIQFNKRLEVFLPAANSNAGWRFAFNEIDTDSSGRVTFDEFEQVVRKKFKMRRADLTDDALQSVWCACAASQRVSIAAPDVRLGPRHRIARAFRLAA